MDLLKDKIFIFTGERCSHCEDLKSYLRANNLEYTELSIKDNSNRRFLFSKAIMEVPVLMYNDITIKGFNRQQVDELIIGIKVGEAYEDSDNY